MRSPPARQAGLSKGIQPTVKIAATLQIDSVLLRTKVNAQAQGFQDEMALSCAVQQHHYLLS
jgi:hypothetical protein